MKRKKQQFFNVYLRISGESFYKIDFYSNFIAFIFKYIRIWKSLFNYLTLIFVFIFPVNQSFGQNQTFDTTGNQNFKISSGVSVLNAGEKGRNSTTETSNLGFPNAATGLTAKTTASTDGSSTLITTVLKDEETTDISITQLQSLRETGRTTDSLSTQTTIAVTSPKITIGANPEVCRGAKSANLSYFAITGNPNQYSINYDSTAESQGFSDVTDAYLPSTPITIKVPVAALDGTYHGTLTVKNSTTGFSSSGSEISVKVNPLPNTGYNVSDTTICSGQEATIKILGTQPVVWYILRNNSDNTVLDSLIGSGLPRKFYATIENSITYNILAKYIATGCSAELMDHSEIKILNFNSSAWNITQFIGGDTISPTPSSVPDLYMKTNTSDFKSENEHDSIGTTNLLYRVDKNNSTKKWSFNYSISGINLKVISTFVSGDVETPTVEGKKVIAGLNNHIFIRFKIQNITNAKMEAHFYIAFGNDLVGCIDEFYDDDDAAIQTIKPTPAVVR